MASFNLSHGLLLLLCKSSLEETILSDVFSNFFISSDFCPKSNPKSSLLTNPKSRGGQWSLVSSKVVLLK